MMMKLNGTLLVAAVASVTMMGCTVNQPPDVVTTPAEHTTVIKEKTTPSEAPHVTINNPAPSGSHTETNTTTTVPTPPTDSSTPSSTTTQSTTTQSTAG